MELTEKQERNIFIKGKRPIAELFEQYKGVVNDFLEVLQKNRVDSESCVKITEELTRSVVSDFKALSCYCKRFSE